MIIEKKKNYENVVLNNQGMFSHCISVNKKKHNYIYYLLKNSGKHVLIIFKLHFHCFFNFIIIILNLNGNKWLFA